MPASQLFPSKRDGWVVVLLLFSIAMSLFGIYVVLTSPEPLTSKLFFGVLVGSTMVFVLWLLASTWYEVSDTFLLVRSGPFRYHIALKSISSVTPSRNPLSSPALSLDRLLIRSTQGPGMILVSPADKSGFLNALVLRCPQLRREGDRLIARDEPVPGR